MRRQGAILAALGWDVWRTTAGAASDAKVNQLDCLELLAMLHFRGFVDTDAAGGASAPSDPVTLDRC